MYCIYGCSRILRTLLRNIWRQRLCLASCRADPVRRCRASSAVLHREPANLQREPANAVADSLDVVAVVLSEPWRSRLVASLGEPALAEAVTVGESDPDVVAGVPANSPYGREGKGAAVAFACSCFSRTRLSSSPTLQTRLYLSWPSRMPCAYQEAAFPNPAGPPRAAAQPSHPPACLQDGQVRQRHQRRRQPHFFTNGEEWSQEDERSGCPLDFSCAL